MPGGQDPLKNTGPTPEAGPALMPSSVWPFTAAPVPATQLATSTLTSLASPIGLSDLPQTDLPPLADMWQVLLDGRLLAGRGTGIGIVTYEGLGLPDQRTSDIPLPSEHGDVALGDYHEPRQLILALCINARELAACGAIHSIDDPAAAAAWDQLRYIAGTWQARTANVLLELRMTTGQTYVLVGRPRRFDADTTLLRLGFVTIAAEFVAMDPRLYDIALAQRSIFLAGPDDVTLGLCLDPAVAPPVGSGAFVREANHTTTGQLPVVRYGWWVPLPRLDVESGAPWVAQTYDPSATVLPTAVTECQLAEDPQGGSSSDGRTVAIPNGLANMTFPATGSSTLVGSGWAVNGPRDTLTPNQTMWVRIEARIVPTPNNAGTPVALPEGFYLAMFVGGVEVSRITATADRSPLTSPLHLQASRMITAGQAITFKTFNPSGAPILVSSEAYYVNPSYVFVVSAETQTVTATSPNGPAAWVCPVSGTYQLDGAFSGFSAVIRRNGYPIDATYRYPSTGPVTLGPVTLALVAGDVINLQAMTHRYPASANAGQLDGQYPLLHIATVGGTPDLGGLCLNEAPWGTASCAISIPPLVTGQVTLTNRGNTDSHPVVTFFGPATNPSIHNLTTDRRLTLSTVIDAGHTVRVNMRTREVTVDGSTALRYDLLSAEADFWPLVPGENIVTLRQAGRESTTATVVWRDAWL